MSQNRNYCIISSGFANLSVINMLIFTRAYFFRFPDRLIKLFEVKCSQWRRQGAWGAHAPLQNLLCPPKWDQFCASKCFKNILKTLCYRQAQRNEMWLHKNTRITRVCNYKQCYYSKYSNCQPSRNLVPRVLSPLHWRDDKVLINWKEKCKIDRHRVT